ncbi:single Ig IL-1-related receptor-like [Anthonomus grandis grandis]|uniref:single Ig IL-1-related receptor-like n=1 Tax=Anthonomus grandis grandis TaxID=2921223 RepID=UPI002165EAEE|nr:single Ig IL-1-related receptor-like [Anthonomus grandis grandis]
MTVYMMLSVLILILGLNFGVAIQDYCSMNNFDGAKGNGMMFTKEANNEEFAVVGKAKGLHCCAKGYKSIEWFKDGKPYPWGLDLSAFIIITANANQTIYNPNIKEGDTGNYTCVLRSDQGNETEFSSHTINFKVFEKLPDDPQITYVSEDREAFAGDPLRLFCEAFGGKVDLPDAHNEAVWRKQLTNGTIIDLPEDNQEKISRESNQIFGTYLQFPKIEEEHYGTYICVITKPGNTINKKVILKKREKVLAYIDPNPFPLKQILTVSIFTVLVLTALLILYKKYGLKIQVVLKDSYGTVEDNDGKSSDAIVAYTGKDTDLVLGVMVPNLEKKGYKVVHKEMSHDITQWTQELSHHAQASRRVIAVLSPSSLHSSWSSSNLYQALKQLQSLTGPKLICVALKELPSSQNDPKNSIGETLATLLKTMKVILWERNDATFWLNLFKEMPAKRGGNASMEMATSRARLTSQRSIDSLVV